MNSPTLQKGWNLNSFLWVNEQKLPGFGKLLGSWFNVHKNFCVGIPPEHSWEYYYTERSQVGLLSNAAALIGGLALEEWGTEKSNEHGKSYGRSDLWLRLSPPSNQNDYQIETKHRRLNLHNSISEIFEIVNQTMRIALADSQKMDSKIGKPVAASFFSLRFEGDQTEILENKTQELLLHIQNQNQQNNMLDAVAGIWMNAEDFQSSRAERNQIAEGWKNDEVGLLLMVSQNFKLLIK